MSLPYSVQYAAVQPIQYNFGNPPFLPQVNVPQQLFGYMAGIASSAANDAGFKSGMNPPRMFVYNMLSSNGWRNDGFAEVVWMAAMILHTGLQKRIYMAPEQGLDPAVAEAMALFTSKMVAEFPELKNCLQQPREHDAVMQNLSVLNSYYQMFGTFQQAHPQQFGGQQGYGQAPTRYGNQQQQQQIHHTPYQFHNQQHNQTGQLRYGGGVQMNNPQAALSSSGVSLGTSGGDGSQHVPDPVDQGRFFTRREPRASQQTQPIVAPQSKEVSAADWKPTPAQPYRTLYNKRTHQKRYILQNNDVLEIIEPKQEKDMDRSQHSIHLLGGTYSLDGVIRTNILGSNLEDLNAISADDIRTLSKEEAPDPLFEAEVNEHLYQKPLVDLYLESMILTGRIKQAIFQQNFTDCNVYRCFGTTFTPHITKEAHSIVLEALSKATSLAELGIRLKSHSIALSDKVREGSEPLLELNDMAIYIHHIDLMLTRRINSFLANELSLTGLAITSFTEDIEKLRAYLKDTYDDRYAAAYDQFEFKTISGLVVAINDETEAELCSLLTDGSSNISFSFVPTTYSLTYLNVLNNELGVTLTQGESLLIREQTSPLLFSVAKSLFDQEKGLPMVPSYNLLITQDQEIYKLHRGYLLADSFMISR